MSRPTETTVLDPPRSQKWECRPIESLYELLYGEETMGTDLICKVEALEPQHGEAVYAELIYLLSHLRFDPAEARQHWNKILEHGAAMREWRGKEVDLRIALVSYFIDVNRKFKNPKIIELQLFETTQAHAYRDEITNLPNYRLFREHLSRELVRSARTNCPVSLVMLDLDDFKAHNDQHGHEAGNRLLAELGALLQRVLRKVDVAARYGGEEFGLILPDTFKTAAFEVAEKVRRAIERKTFTLEADRRGCRATASFGVATYPADGVDTDALIRAADRAMYLAKDEGKNQVRLYGQDRRSYQRIAAALPGQYRLISTEVLELATVNVSEGGLLFVGDRRLPRDSMVQVRLTLPDSGKKIEVCGRVVSVKERGDGSFETALRTVYIPGKHRGYLARYLAAVTPKRPAD